MAYLTKKLKLYDIDSKTTYGSQGIIFARVIAVDGILQVEGY